MKGLDEKMFVEVMTLPDEPHPTIANESEIIIADRPVLVFVHGGAWGSGRPWQYSLAAHNMGMVLHASKVILLAYPYYPEASILQQRDAVLAALHYVREHREELGIGSQQAVVLTGHSSGANISALALLQHYLEEEEEAEEKEKMKISHEGLGEASQHEYHHPLVEMFIGLSGVYDIERHYHYESNRSVEQLSPMAAAAGGVDKFITCSPTLLLQKRSSTQDDQTMRNNTQFPFVAVVHGTEDTVVPHISTEEYETALKAYHVHTPIYSYYPSYSHMMPLVDLMMMSAENDTKTSITDAYKKFLNLRCKV